MKLRDYIPDNLLEQIQFRYLEGVSNAESFFEDNEDDEDALTGALGQAISMKNSIVHEDGSGTYELKISSKKIRGRGPGAPEKRLGADGIFQIQIFKDDKSIFSKGLPFQSKKTNSDTRKSVIQAKKNAHSH
jgi:hypothetical protein